MTLPRVWAVLEDFEFSNIPLCVGSVLVIMSLSSSGRPSTNVVTTITGSTTSFVIGVADLVWWPKIPRIAFRSFF